MKRKISGSTGSDEKPSIQFPVVETDVDAVFSAKEKQIKKREGKSTKVEKDIAKSSIENFEDVYFSDKYAGTNLGTERTSVHKVSMSGFVKNHSLRKKPSVAPIRVDSAYKYSDAVIRRVRNTELAVRAKAIVQNMESFLVTLTFAKSVSNEERWLINDRFRKNVRMYAKDGGMWCAEAHTGNDYVNRNGEEVKGDKEMRGKIHFHYRINTRRTWDEVRNWLEIQAEIDKQAGHAYDVKKSFKKYIYLSIHESKKEQKELVFHKGRIWASWGVDKKPELISEVELETLNTVSKICGKMVFVATDANLFLQKLKLMRNQTKQV